MPKHIRLYILVVLTLLLAACQKEPLAGNKDYQTLGTSAHDLLSSSTYTSLRIQLSYMPGYKPDAASVNSLDSFLRTYLNKPGGIQIFTHAIAASGKATLTLNDVVSIERNNRVEFTAGNTLGVHILLADAGYTDANDLAISYWNTSFCLFGKTIDESSASTGQVNHSNLISTLLQHEFGHLLGLVGQGSPEQAPHRDATNGAHCSNPDCLMYYSVETDAASGLRPVLDANCIADLKANGSK